MLGSPTVKQPGRGFLLRVEFFPTVRSCLLHTFRNSEVGWALGDGGGSGKLQGPAEPVDPGSSRRCWVGFRIVFVMLMVVKLIYWLGG